MRARLWSKSSLTGRNSSCLPRSALSRWPASVFSCSKQFSAVVATKLSIWQRSTYPGKEQQPKSTLYKLSSRKRNPSDALRIRPHDSGCFHLSHTQLCHHYFKLCQFLFSQPSLFCRDV